MTVDAPVATPVSTRPLVDPPDIELVPEVVALITTTAIVAGFQILEFIKIIKFNKSEKDNLEIYKNRFVNTSINYCDGITPYTPKYTVLNNKKLKER